MYDADDPKWVREPGMERTMTTTTRTIAVGISSSQGRAISTRRDDGDDAAANIVIDHDGGRNCRRPGHCCGPLVVSLTSRGLKGVEE